MCASQINQPVSETDVYETDTFFEKFVAQLRKLLHEYNSGQIPAQTSVEDAVGVSVFEATLSDGSTRELIANGRQIEITLSAL